MGAQGQAATEVLRTYAHTEVRLSTVGQSPRDPENTRPTLANQNAAWHPSIRGRFHPPVPSVAMRRRLTQADEARIARPWRNFSECWTAGAGAASPA